MSCSEVMYQAYYPYLYQRAGAAPPVSAHPVPRAGPFTSPFGAAHQYDRVGNFTMELNYEPEPISMEDYLRKDLNFPEKTCLGVV